MVESVLDFINGNAPLAYAVIFAMCFGESLAFISLLTPGWAFMIAAGALVQSGALGALPVVLAGAAGATLGDALSYWIGLRFKHVVPRLWPFTRHPDWLDRGHAFFKRHGGKSVFLGRFFGPVRAVIPLAAGMMEMPAVNFWIANVASAALWAVVVVTQGAAVGWGIAAIDFADPKVQVLLIVGAGLAVAGYLVYRRHKQRC
ncbi:MAG: DedA family protein [Alphaproteobacteria bacterium]|nr:DedA family protein [Alphaproteobacteria bacterium]